MNNWIYIAVMFAVSYAIRILPLTLIRKPIENQFIQSFLYYVPYVTLAVMTFPAIVNATQSPIAGAAALVVGIIAAWMGAGLFPVSVLCCAVVLVLEFFLASIVDKVIELELPASSDGIHSLTLTPNDPAIVFEKIVIDGREGKKSVKVI